MLFDNIKFEYLFLNILRIKNQGASLRYAAGGKLAVLSLPNYKTADVDQNRKNVHFLPRLL